MQGYIVALIAAGGAILGAALGGAITLSADNLKARRDERIRLRELRLGTYSRVLRAAKGVADTSAQRISVMSQISGRRAEGEDTFDLDDQLEKLDGYGSELKATVSEMEIIATPAVLKAAQSLQGALEDYDSAMGPIAISAWSYLNRLQSGEGPEEEDPNERDERKQANLKFGQAKRSVEQARANFSDAAKRELGLSISTRGLPDGSVEHRPD